MGFHLQHRELLGKCYFTKLTRISSNDQVIGSRPPPHGVSAQRLSSLHCRSLDSAKMKRRATSSTVAEGGEGLDVVVTGESSTPRRRSARLVTNEGTLHSPDRAADQPRKRVRPSPPSASTSVSDDDDEATSDEEPVPIRQRRLPPRGPRNPKPRLSKTNPDSSSRTERGLHLGHRPISDIRDMFGDLVSKACELGLGSSPLFGNHRAIRIATMCSGTESPLLACRLISQGIVSTVL